MCFQTVPEQIHQGTGGVSIGVSDVHVSVGEKNLKAMGVFSRHRSEEVTDKELL